MRIDGECPLTARPAWVEVNEIANGGVRRVVITTNDDDCQTMPATVTLTPDALRTLALTLHRLAIEIERSGT